MVWRTGSCSTAERPRCSASQLFATQRAWPKPSQTFRGLDGSGALMTIRDGTPHGPPDPVTSGGSNHGMWSRPGRFGGRTNARRGSRPLGRAGSPVRDPRRSRMAVNVEFWRAVLGYEAMSDDDAVDPLGHGSTVWMEKTTRPGRCGTPCTLTCWSRANTWRRGSRRHSPQGPHRRRLRGATELHARRRDRDPGGSHRMAGRAALSYSTVDAVR